LELIARDDVRKLDTVFPEFFSVFQEKISGMALLHESKIKRYDPRHSGNCAAIIRNLWIYHHWIPDIFP
jgi:hypothetical protein